MYDWQRYNRVGSTVMKRLHLLWPFIHPVKRQFLVAKLERMQKREEISQESVEYHLDRELQKRR